MFSSAASLRVGIELDLRKKSWAEIFIVLKEILEELGGGKV